MIASSVSGLYILKNGGKCGIIYDVGQTDKSKFVEINIRISFIKRGADHLMLEIDIRKVINIEDGKLFYHDFNDTVSAIDLNAIADHHQKRRFVSKIVNIDLLANESIHIITWILQME